ncbi:hypothetical protein B5X24_HaOG206980 [Helicoverpa armigera]|nr:hypothetical protein B5X24_HaOG206980 [Helicoverpa armigera]
MKHNLSLSLPASLTHMDQKGLKGTYEDIERSFLTGWLVARALKWVNRLESLAASAPDGLNYAEVKRSPTDRLPGVQKC